MCIFFIIDSNYILLYDNIYHPQFVWYESKSLVNSGCSLLEIFVEGMEEVSFSKVFESLNLFQQEHLIYMMNIFTEKND
jgi:hypothetical protein